MQSYGTWGIALAFFAQGIGFPLPLPVTFGALAVLVERGVLTPGEAFATCLGASWAGNLTAYAGAMLGARWVGNLARAGVAKLRCHFWSALLLTRWTSGYAQVIWAAGAARRSPAGVAAGTLACNATWAAFWSWASVRGVEWAGKVPGAAAAAAALILVVVLVSRYLIRGGARWGRS